MSLPDCQGLRRAAISNFAQLVFIDSARNLFRGSPRVFFLSPERCRHEISGLKPLALSLEILPLYFFHEFVSNFMFLTAFLSVSLLPVCGPSS